MNFWRFVVLGLALSLFCPTAWAGGLSEKDVKRFVATMEDLKPLFDQYTDEIEDDGDASSTARIVSDWTANLREQRQAEAILARHGFEFESWSTVAQQVTHAYLAVKLGADGEDVVGQLRQNMAEIEASKDVPPEYKAQILDQMKQGMQEFEKLLDTDPADQAAVKPFVADLDRVFEWHE